jgi:predicted DNA-binding protein (UPF0278 family)
MLKAILGGFGVPSNEAKIIEAVVDICMKKEDEEINLDDLKELPHKIQTHVMKALNSKDLDIAELLDALELNAEVKRKILLAYGGIKGAMNFKVGSFKGDINSKMKDKNAQEIEL